MDDINTMLLIAALEAEEMVEPCDECHPLDWASVVNVDIWEELYPQANECTGLCLEEFFARNRQIENL